MYGGRAACQQGYSTRQTAQHGEDDPIPTRKSIEKELQVDIFYIFGQGFLLRISALCDVTMMTGVLSSWCHTVQIFSAKMRAQICRRRPLALLIEWIQA
jgi:hypothetical protein